jgi:hypothetical protein
MAVAAELGAEIVTEDPEDVGAGLLLGLGSEGG